MINFVKRISIIMTAALICSFSVSVINAAQRVASNGFTYLLYDDYAVIDEYYGDETNVVIPAKIWSKDITEVGDYAFIENDVVKSVSFKNADKITHFGFNAFYGCKNLEKIDFPENISVIGIGCFQNCTSLREANINGKINQIPEQSFWGCTALKSVKLPESVTAINKYAFANCSSLTYIYIPNSVTSINSNAFNGSPNVVINCRYGSYAFEYALKNNIAYNIIDGFALGDVNHNGSLEIDDATELQRHLADYVIFDDYILKLSDYDGDGIVCIIDVTAIQKTLAEL